MIIAVTLIAISECVIDYYTKFRVLTGGLSKMPPVFKKNEGFIQVRTPVKNHGAILGFLKNKRKTLNFFTIISILLLLGSIIYNCLTEDIIAIPLSVMLGGGLGNLFDRIINGGVTDFLVFKGYRNIVFNFADIFILIGCIGTVITVIVS